MERLRVLIVGAGVAGLAAARTLRRFAPDVVERLPAWGEAGAGLYLPGNATRALRLLGLEEAVAERAVVIPRQRFCDQRGRLLADVDLAAMWGDVGDCIALPHADLHEVLRDGVSVRMGVTVQALAQEGGRVAVELSDGSGGDYDLVLGADGVHSTVRRLAFDGAPARSVGQVGWRFMTDAPAPGTWSVLLGNGLAFLTIPMGGGRVYCYGDAGAQAPLPELFAGFAQPVPAILDALPDEQAVHVAQIEEVHLDAWSRGSVLLVGDAAHATSPNMAEGAAMALEDALVLGDCLAALPTVAQALEAYEARRRPRTDWVRAQTHRRDRTRNLPGPLRNLVLRLLGPQIQRANYRPLLSEH